MFLILTVKMNAIFYSEDFLAQNSRVVDICEPSCRRHVNKILSVNVMMEQTDDFLVDDFINGFAMNVEAGGVENEEDDPLRVPEVAGSGPHHAYAEVYDTFLDNGNFYFQMPDEGNHRVLAGL